MPALRPLPVKNAAPISRGSTALVVPGGESTTVMKLLERFDLAEPIVARVRAGMPLWGTCMGMIVAAHDVVGLDQPTLDLIDVSVRRNAFGRQNESAEVDLSIPVLGASPFRAIFIRAPWIERAGPQVDVLAERAGHGVMVRQGNVLGTSFHPELGGDLRVHEYFLEMIGAAAAACREGLHRRVTSASGSRRLPKNQRGGFQGQIPPVEPLLTEVIATLSLAAHAYLTEQRRPRTRSRVGGGGDRRCQRGFRTGQRTPAPEERLAITQMLTETRLTFVRKRGI